MSPARIPLLLSLFLSATIPLASQQSPSPPTASRPLSADPAQQSPKCRVARFPLPASCNPDLPCSLPGGGTSASDILQFNGITDLSARSLLAALSDCDPFIRFVAADQLLITDHDRSAIQAVEKALSIETDGAARVNMASSLVSVFDPVGATTLTAMCTDASLPSDVTVSAVQQVAILHQFHPEVASPGICADAVLAKLESAKESWERRELVSVLPSMIHQVPSDKADRMIADARKLTSDSEEPGTIVEARDALEQMQRNPRHVPQP